ncbi:TetR/AcrR family transcriptional regulator [Variovorax sp. dw_954]|uniref:TetR/AcrR family transcriptional regulator n=1 Tax=Variovorax sp. dw_954 TaxID=2720078 RepID=UPI001BD6367A|nr:TetR/AcrR family transcriptional regulator [Variovorax sp. dw_954]
MSAPKPRPTPDESPAVTARVARREQRRNRSREEILEGARRVLLRSGISATTLDSVAREIGVSKAALYYYFPSKDALLFELVYGALDAHAQAVHGATGKARNGGDALRAIVRETVHAFAPRIDDFRLAFLHGQVASPGSVHWDEQQFQRIRPLNDLCFADAAKMLAEERKKRPGRARVEPRLMAFLAYLAAVGMLTMKGMVESVDDPLAYSDEQLIEGFARVFEAAAGP